MTEHFRSQIIEVFNEVYKSRVESSDVPKLSDDTVLLDTGLDSLGFAILVVRLEEELGFDPFVLSDNARYPKTFAEFVQMYVENMPQ